MKTKAERLTRRAYGPDGVYFDGRATSFVQIHVCYSGAYRLFDLPPLRRLAAIWLARDDSTIATDGAWILKGPPYDARLVSGRRRPLITTGFYRWLIEEWHVEEGEPFGLRMWHEEWL